jgi:cytochrome P450
LSFTLKLLEHDPELFPEPEKFKPERWLAKDVNVEMRKRTSITFGTGTRTCLGQYIARNVLRKTIAALVYNFDMSFVNPERDRHFGYKYLNTYPKKGQEDYLMIRAVPRFRSISQGV